MFDILTYMFHTVAIIGIPVGMACIAEEVRRMIWTWRH